MPGPKNHRTAAHQGGSLSPPRAAAALCAWLGLVVAACAVTWSPARSGHADGPERGPGDVALYRAEVDRIAAGQSYYAAAAAELRSRGYPTRSVLNWRTPLPLALVGRLGNLAWSKLLLGAAALLLFGWSFDLVAREGSLSQAMAAGTLLTGALMPVGLGDLFLMPEVWSGVLVALALVARARGSHCLGVAIGGAALFMRELAVVYVAVAVALALAERRGRELASWAAVLTAYAGFYAWHLAQVRPLIGPADVAHAQGWWQLGGLAVVLATCQMNSYLLLLPQCVTAVVWVLAMLGASRWQTAAGRGVGCTLAAYGALFAALGQGFNQYWGSMFAPLVCLTAPRGAAQLIAWAAVAWPKTAKWLRPRQAARRAT